MVILPKIPIILLLFKGNHKLQRFTFFKNDSIQIKKALFKSAFFVFKNEFLKVLILNNKTSAEHPFPIGEAKEIGSIWQSFRVKAKLCF